MATDARLLEQTRWAWINEYGPAQAEQLLAQLDALRGAEPALALADAIARVDPENPDRDYEDFVATRW